MASLSIKYLFKESDLAKAPEGERSIAVNALVHSVKIDLKPLLIAADKKINELPIIYSSEAHA